LLGHHFCCVFVAEPVSDLAHLIKMIITEASKAATFEQGRYFGRELVSVKIICSSFCLHQRGRIYTEEFFVKEFLKPYSGSYLDRVIGDYAVRNED
jgi:hypothetical protein